MTDELPKWPASLPPPIEISEGAPQVYLCPDDLADADSLQGLAHDLYWYADNVFFLYFPYGRGIGTALSERFKVLGVGTKKTELYFYRHPKPAFKNDFVRALPHAELPVWVKEAATGPMFGRTLLSLEGWKRKQLDLQYGASATAAAISEKASIVELKPALWGMSINVRTLWKRLRRWWEGKNVGKPRK